MVEDINIKSVEETEFQSKYRSGTLEEGTMFLDETKASSGITELADLISKSSQMEDRLEEIFDKFSRLRGFRGLDQVAYKEDNLFYNLAFDGNDYDNDSSEKRAEDLKKLPGDVYNELNILKGEIEDTIEAITYYSERKNFKGEILKKLGALGKVKSGVDLSLGELTVLPSETIFEKYGIDYFKIMDIKANMDGSSEEEIKNAIPIVCKDELAALKTDEAKAAFTAAVLYFVKDFDNDKVKYSEASSIEMSKKVSIKEVEPYQEQYNVPSIEQDDEEDDDNSENNSNEEIENTNEEKQEEKEETIKQDENNNNNNSSNSSNDNNIQKRVVVTKTEESDDPTPIKKEVKKVTQEDETPKNETKKEEVKEEKKKETIPETKEKEQKVDEKQEEPEPKNPKEDTIDKDVDEKYWQPIIKEVISPSTEPVNPSIEPANNYNEPVIEQPVEVQVASNPETPTITPVEIPKVPDEPIVYKPQDMVSNIKEIDKIETKVEPVQQNPVQETESSNNSFVPPIAGIAAAATAGVGTKIYLDKTEGKEQDKAKNINLDEFEEDESSYNEEVEEDELPDDDLSFSKDRFLDSIE